MYFWRKPIDLTKNKDIIQLFPNVIIRMATSIMEYVGIK